MNFQRVIRVTNCYLFLTGYQIRCYDRKSMHYRLEVFGIFYFLTLFLLYLICFCHHFESSSMLKLLKDMSPFLIIIVYLQVILGIIIFIFCIIENKNLTKISNGLVRILIEEIESHVTFDISEACVYILFFSTLLVFTSIIFYIAIELKFELPPIDNIMIGMALCIPHFTLAGCLRMYTLGLWLIKGKLISIHKILSEQKLFQTVPKTSQCIISVEICNPGLNATSSDVKLCRILKEISKSLDLIAEHMKLFDEVSQRQLILLAGMNFNVLLAGAYACVYFENSWNLLFTNRDRRVFYAANSIIFACILVDYGTLLYARWSFCQARQNFHNLVRTQLFANIHIKAEMKTILKYIKSKLSKELKLKLYGLVEFNTWNFLMFHGLTILIISLTVNNQYLNDQIKALNERLDVTDTE